VVRSAATVNCAAARRVPGPEVVAFSLTLLAWLTFGGSRSTHRAGRADRRKTSCPGLTAPDTMARMDL